MGPDRARHKQPPGPAPQIAARRRSAAVAPTRGRWRWPGPRRASARTRFGQRGQLAQLQQKHSARQAFERLRDQGVIRYIGVTGHSSRLLADALEDYPYDCALITLNAAREVMDDPEDLDRFFRLARDQEVGVIAMKVVARGALIERGLEVRQLLPYVLSYPVSTAIVGITDLAHLEQNVRVARAFEPLGEKERAEIRALAQS